jgi:hypothetical protein
MIETTDSALNILRQMLERSEPPETHRLRLMLGSAGPTIVTDEVRADDVTVVEDDNEPIVVAEPSIADRFDEFKLDFDSASSQLTMV